MELKDLCGKPAKSIQWYEGVLLAPHHFQQSDYYYHQRTSFLARASNYFSYGIIKLISDPAVLISGTYRVQMIDAIMPDGSILHYNAEESPVKYEKNLSEIVKNQRSVRIYISVPVHKSGQSNYSGEIPRYSGSKERVLDENTGEDEVEVVKKEQLFYIHTEDELSPKFASIPVAEITFSNTGIQKTHYIPPLIFMDQSGELYNLCKMIVQIIKQKIGYIIGKRKFLTTTEGLDEKLHLLIVNTLPVEAVLNTFGVKPFDVYMKLIDLASVLIAITHGDIIPEVPRYIHEDLYTTFYALQTTITQGIDKIIDTSSSVPFMMEDDIFFLKLEQSWVKESDDRILIGIRKAPSATYDEFVHWINGLQITSRLFIQDVLQRRVLGANRQIENNMEVLSSISDNIINLSIDAHSSHIKLGEELCIFNKSQDRAADEIVLLLKEAE